MDPLTTTTRPAGTGGIDISGIDVATAVFTATGGGYGAPTTSTLAGGGSPSTLPDWYTNFGNGTLADAFDFGTTAPPDRDAPIKLLAEPEGSHPLLDLFQDDQPILGNGGPEGTACVEVIAAVVIVAVILWAADDLSDGAICDFLGWKHDKYTDPDAMTGEGLPSPAAMLADLLGKAGIPGVDPTSPGITDLLGKLADNMSKVNDLVGALTGAAQAGDDGAVQGAVARLMQLAGLDGVKLGSAEVMDGVFDAFGIVGGIEGAGWLAALRETGEVHEVADLAHLLSDQVHWTYDFG